LYHIVKNTIAEIARPYDRNIIGCTIKFSAHLLEHHGAPQLASNYFELFFKFIIGNNNGINRGHIMTDELVYFAHELPFAHYQLWPKDVFDDARI
jgi:hypothetical protein